MGRYCRGECWWCGHSWRSSSLVKLRNSVFLVWLLSFLHRAGGYVGVFDLATGSVLPSFNGGQVLRVAGVTNEFRGLSVRDVENDGSGFSNLLLNSTFNFFFCAGAEILLGLAISGNINSWLLNGDGTVRAGWPKRSSDQDAYTWGKSKIFTTLRLPLFLTFFFLFLGVYSNNGGISQMDNDTPLEIG